MTYSLINAPFLLLVLVVLVVALVRNGRSRPGRPGMVPRPLAVLAITLCALLVTTAIFDNVIIGLGIVAYDPSHTSGITVGLAPIEDFAYAIAAAIGLPALWMLLPAREERS
jgi:lycopene cyclase domain-containing protein